MSIAHCGTADNPSAAVAAFIAAGNGLLTLSPSTAKRPKIAVYFQGEPCCWISQKADGTLRVRNRPQGFNETNTKPGPLAKKTIAWARARAKNRKKASKELV